MSATIIPNPQPASSMGDPNLTATKKSGVAARLVAFLVVIGIIAGVSYGAIAIARNLTKSNGNLVFHTVRRTSLPITVKERGNLESQVKTTIECKVESYGRERGSDGTPIIEIVPNGSPVKKGDLLVELDSAPLQELLDSGVLSTTRARSEATQALLTYENQKTQNETLYKEAELKVELADLELRMYTDGDDGTLQIALQELELKIEEAQNQILEAQAESEMQKIERDGVELLHSLGYRGQGDRRQALLRYLQAQDALVRATNQLRNAKSNFRKLKEYEGEMQIKQLSGALATAKRNLIQVERDNESLLAQALAEKNGAERSLAKEEERLAKYKTQLEHCKIYAPHDGLVVYAVDRRGGSGIREGAQVRRRQSILTLPNLNAMQVKTSVHESVLDKVNAGLQSIVKINAAQRDQYPGKVASVAVLPDQSRFGSDIKVYETIVKLDGDVKGLRPGMTAEVEILIDDVKDVIAIPVQAVVQHKDETWCYAMKENTIQKLPLTIGRTNDRFVEVVSGLVVDTQVVLNPMAIIDEDEFRDPDETDNLETDPTETAEAG